MLCQDLEAAVDYEAIRAHCETKEVGVSPPYSLHLSRVYGMLTFGGICAKDEQVLLSFAFTIKRLLDVIIRDRMDFLLPEKQMHHHGDSSASQKDSLAQQQALVRKIPSDFQQPFLQTLREKYNCMHERAPTSFPIWSADASDCFRSTLLPA